MILEKKEQFAEILYKEIQAMGTNAIKSFSIELMDKDSETADSMLFNSLHEAVEIIAEFAGKDKKKEIKEDILSYISMEELQKDPSFRLKIIVGEVEE
jgi:hypothetical protein